MFRSLNKLGPLASESVDYEAKTIIKLKNKPAHQISALYVDRSSARPIFVLRSQNKLGPLASESVDYEAKTIINFKTTPTHHQISSL